MRPKAKLFQSLTPNHGYIRLREHLASVTAIMKLSKDLSQFMDRLDQFHPKFGDNLRLPFTDYDQDADDGQGF